ncbi:alpha/beta fold hydrolase [Alteromonas lipolytica]|uniref:AB hydrolase-1 domain-containing protein n=1 Tax=Alteromonas lipolytica TaxID=1856405 RepID=A0A1E8FD27_9ALTE|nr:alpha/beta hydrolase [Alteromonas lipolytica]OFI33393.1 hypothetical protein BFC17_03785 [Alteromonas lipolytica]GGF60081.1 hypothetical protein GCM10011338_10450 [Alteromonas lipolytica]
MVIKRTFIDGDYGQIHLRIAGPDSHKIQQPPLLCLHMSPKSGRIFARFMQQMAVDRLVVAPDYPGYGESDCPPASPAVSIEDYARGMWQVVSALKLSRVDILGYHTGSLVAAEMVHQSPDSVNRIIMIGAPVFSAEVLAQVKSYFQPVPLDTAGTRFITMWQRVLEHGGKGNTLELAAESFAENLRAGENYEWGHHAAFAYAPVFPQRVSEITQRIDVINPDDDLKLPTRAIEGWLQQGEIHERPAWGHGFLDYDTDNAVKDIRELLLLQ